MSRPCLLVSRELTCKNRNKNNIVEAENNFHEGQGQQTNQGGSSFDRGDMATAIPMAFVNILFRPFITEANSPMALVSSLEMLVFWALALRNVFHLKSMLQGWRGNRLLRFAVPFALLYVLMIGLTFQNFGIIARQRTLVMPALLLLFAAAPAAGARRVIVTRPRPAWRSAATSPSLAPVAKSS